MGLITAPAVNTKRSNQNYTTLGTRHGGGLKFETWTAAR